MSRRDGESAPVVTEFACADPATLELAFRTGASQVVDSVDRSVDHSVVARHYVAAAVSTRVLAAVWCCSVGTTWTVELHEFNRGAALGPIVDWISSGVPISDPQPTVALACGLLTERGFQLSPDSSASPCGFHRRGIGYACQGADLVEADTLGARPGHEPMATHARRVSDPRCVTPSRLVSQRDGRVEAAETEAACPQVPKNRLGAAARRRGRGFGYDCRATAEAGALGLVPEADPGPATRALEHKSLLSSSVPRPQEATDEPTFTTA
jgi:hypothetical protein